MSLPRPLLCIDVETTGLDPVAHDICSIGVIVLDENLRPGNAYSSFVKPFDSLRSPEAMQTHGIPEEVLRSAPSFKEVAERLESVCRPNSKDYMVASWGLFDYSFLKESYRKAYRFFPFSYRTFDLKSVCLWELSKKTPVVHQGLGPMMEAAGLAFKGQQHDAFDDIKNTVNLFRHLAGIKEEVHG